jgi:hypothetical protein
LLDHSSTASKARFHIRQELTQEQLLAIRSFLLLLPVELALWGITCPILLLCSTGFFCAANTEKLKQKEHSGLLIAKI